MTIKSWWGIFGVAFLGLSMAGCGSRGPEHGRADSAQAGKTGVQSASVNAQDGASGACAALGKRSYVITETLKSLEKLKGDSAEQAEGDAMSAAMDFSAAETVFNPEAVHGPISPQAKSALAELHDALKRVGKDLDPAGDMGFGEKKTEPDVQAALRDGKQVSEAFAKLKSACGQS